MVEDIQELLLESLQLVNQYFKPHDNQSFMLSLCQARPVVK